MHTQREREMQVVVQQWLSTSKKSKSPVVVQSMRTFQMVFSICQNPAEVDCNTSKGMNLPGKMRALTSSMSLMETTTRMCGPG